MNKLSRIANACLAFILISCTNSMTELHSIDECEGNCVVPTKSVDNQELIVSEVQRCVENDYVIMDGSHLEFTKSKDEILKDGISEMCYELLAEEIIKANILNDKIAETYSKDSTVSSISFVLVKEFSNNNKKEAVIRRIKYRSEPTITMPSGTLSSNGTPSYSDFWAPTPMIGVTGSCYAYTALVPYHAVTTQVGNEVLTSSRLYNGKLSIGIPFSNTQVRISYQTTDSNGGFYSWNGFTADDVI